MIAAPPTRYYHLDALRAFAMMLGLVLHALLAYSDTPIWPAQDLHQHQAYGIAQHAIHGFRMALFFLISGYFTTMLWRRRGLGPLINHRVKRILLPMVVAWLVFVPLTIVVSLLGGSAKKDLEDRHLSAVLEPSAGTSTITIWGAARTGNTEVLRQHLERGLAPDLKDKDGLTALTWASLLGQQECAALLIRHGAYVNTRDGKGNTPLHAAALLGRSQSAQLLLAHGADVNAVSLEGNTPLDSAAAHWWIVQATADMAQFEVDQEEITTGRAELISLLASKGARTNAALLGIPPWAGGLYRLYQFGALIPLFLHLWFLYYLLWLVTGFVFVAWIAGKLHWRGPPAWLISSPICWLWLIPLTALPQFFMRQSFGPDTAMGILPWPPKLLYYAIFFGFGALSFGRTAFEEKAGRWWPLCFLFSIPPLCLGLHLFLDRPDNIPHAQLLLSLSLTLYAWLMIYGSLGFFRRFFSSLSTRIRYLSDASYWIYLAHLPLVLGLQIIIMPWPLPSFLKFLAVCAVTYGILLLLYRHFVRHTWIGTMLNGKKVAIPPLPQSADSATASDH
ncbi:MAG: acyltransferase family protein [Roseibacillus sp.]|nr:acyltransferase family protein [Roseibacillus sp.]